jgi:ABC-2 type transport system permease protein
MNFFRTQYVAYVTMMRREYIRIVRIWVQTLVPPLITTGLYFLIFGQLIGSQVGGIAGFSYMQYIAPGLILMSLATAAFTNVVFSFYFSKFQRSLEEVLVAPVHPFTIVLGFVSGGVIRALLVTILSILMMLLFIPLSVASISAVLFFSLGTALLFSLGGMINAIYANKIDSLSIFSTFILTPLTYFGGVFYSLSLLPELWQKLSYLNPVMYLINGFRYGFLGVSDVSIWACAAVLSGLIIAAVLWLLVLFKQGRGLKI